MLSGVYFLLDEKGEVIYVGQSNNIAVRVQDHRSRGLKFHRVFAIEESDETVRLLKENVFLVAMGPRENLSGPRTPPMRPRGTK